MPKTAAMSDQPGTGSPALAPSGHVTHRGVLAIALPIVVSNISTPLLGLVDTAIIGQLGDATLIGAVAIGATIFSMLFWGFGFLRMGTTGLTAQADGAGDDAGVVAALGRALVIAAAAAALVIALQGPTLTLALVLIDGSEAVEAKAAGYFAIRIWSAPFAFANYAMLGWFIGQGRAGTALALQLVLNVSNILLDAGFVLGLGWDVEGVAMGTVIAEAIAAATGAVLVARAMRRRGARFMGRDIFAAAPLAHTIMVNGDIMARTLCLVFAFAFFTAQGARHGDVTLAANAILIHFMMLGGYLLDGFAFAAETLAGRAVGARQRGRFMAAVRISSLWAVLLAACLSAVFLAAGGFAAELMTTSEPVRQAARAHLPWVAALPLAGVAAYQLDGIFIGATRTRDLRNMMMVSLAVYLSAWWLLTPAFGNHGLWAALLIFMAARAVTLALRFPALLRDVFGS